MSPGVASDTPSAILDVIRSELSNLANEVMPVLSHWLDLFARHGGLPDRRDFSPEAMKTALPHVWLCDFSRLEDRFRYRLGGEQVVASLGGPLRGRYLDEVTDPEAYPRVHAYFRKCVDLPAALRISGRIYAEQSRVATGERLMLPYVDGSEEVAGILGATFRRWDNQNQPNGLERKPGSRQHLWINLDHAEVEQEDHVVP
ncbi:MAG: PAS domain-containing protein [Alphaproteobacteria bacterium]|jgi:hypothetical protein|nr:PAS domain-containing protein [Alphaproteobacteria bacterium]